MKSPSARGATAFYVYMIQDLDLLLPLMLLDRRENRPIRVIVERSLLRKSPRVGETLKNYGIQFEQDWLPRQVRKRLKRWLGDWPKLAKGEVSALVTAVESNAGPHRQAHRLVQRAKKIGIRTVTLQHGFENIGLTYADEKFPFEKVAIESDVIGIWFPIEQMPAVVSPKIRAKCRTIGFPKNFDLLPSKPLLEKLRDNYDTIVSVFENLHWHRYDDLYRSSFIAMCLHLARKMPSTLFVLKPHHAGLWLSKNGQSSIVSQPNVLFVDPLDPKWEPYTAAALVRESDAVITTPSTVAVDAAKLGVPTIVTGFHLDVSTYEPLPIVRTLADAEAFLAASLESESSECLGRFLGRHGIADLDPAAYHSCLTGTAPGPRREQQSIYMEPTLH